MAPTIEIDNSSNAQEILLNGAVTHLVNGVGGVATNVVGATTVLMNGRKPAKEHLSGVYTPIPQFYAGRSIFITGGTGFMGKVLVEKLLRSCPDIKNIYLLIRPKRGQEAKSRLNELLNAPLFDKLRKEKPKELDKIIPISGDITSEELGISESDQALLCRTVSIVFHSAATVKFDEKLKLSVTINMLGTKRLVQLCHRMMALDVCL